MTKSALQKGKFNVVFDTQWGSTGKGLAASYLAMKNPVTHASTNNLPNAGHTAVFSDGFKFVSKILPVCAAANRYGREVKPVIGPGAGFMLKQLMSEIEELGIPLSFVSIHPRAMVVTEDHRTNEQISTKHIASTMQGSGAAQAEKLMRLPHVKLARDYPELAGSISEELEHHFGMMVNDALKGHLWLHEGSQGYSLDIQHGSHYPQCTSRSTGVVREMADMGVNPRKLGEVVGVLRPYPIRVGNVVEGGQQVGYSGDCYPDQREITWDDVRSACRGPESLGQGELTTVTKRLRRVFTFSHNQVRQACVVNGVTSLFLNFAQYIDYNAVNAKTYDEMPPLVKEFVDDLERNVGVPVKWLGVGASIDNVIER